MKIFVLLSVAAVMLLGGSAAAVDSPIKATNTWVGANGDETLAKELPENGVITSAKDFEKLIKSWQVAEKTPEVDFDAELVLVTTTRGSSLSLKPVLDDKGNLQARAISTRDLRPGFRYLIISVPKKGVKTVNGKELPK